MDGQEIRRYVIADFPMEQSTLTLGLLDDGDRTIYTLECNPCFGHSPVGWAFDAEIAFALVNGIAAGEPFLLLNGADKRELRDELARQIGLSGSPQGVIDVTGEEVDGEFREVGGDDDDEWPEFGCVGGLCEPVRTIVRLREID